MWGPVWEFPSSRLTVASDQTIIVNCSGIRIDNSYFLADDGSQYPLTAAGSLDVNPNGQNPSLQWAALDGSTITGSRTIVAFYSYVNTQYNQVWGIGPVALMNTASNNIEFVLQQIGYGNVEVVDVNLSANTLVVDGGTWSNGEVVTAPEKSGTGNFAGNTGAVVDVSNSNQQWIDNTNRLSEEFFIKAASTRTGLAILRQQAIKLAAKVVASMDAIKDGDYAIVDGNYWFRDEDNLINLGTINLPSK